MVKFSRTSLFAAAAFGAFCGTFTSVISDKISFLRICLVATTPSSLEDIAMFSTHCASVTPRVDVDVAMSSPRRSLWLGNQTYTKVMGEGKRGKGKKRRKAQKRGKTLAVFQCSSVLSMDALTRCSCLLMTTSSTLLCLVEDQSPHSSASLVCEN